MKKQNQPQTAAYLSITTHQGMSRFVTTCRSGHKKLFGEYLKELDDLHRLSPAHPIFTARYQIWMGYAVRDAIKTDRKFIFDRLINFFKRTQEHPLHHASFIEGIATTLGKTLGRQTNTHYIEALAPYMHALALPARRRFKKDVLETLSMTFNIELFDYIQQDAQQKSFFDPLSAPELVLYCLNKSNLANPQHIEAKRSAFIAHINPQEWGHFKQNVSRKLLCYGFKGYASNLDRLLSHHGLSIDSYQIQDFFTRLGRIRFRSSQEMQTGEIIIRHLVQHHRTDVLMEIKKNLQRYNQNTRFPSVKKQDIINMIESMTEKKKLECHIASNLELPLTSKNTQKI